MKKNFSIFTFFIISLVIIQLTACGSGGSTGNSGANGPGGISIHWLGSFASAPADPETNDAYFNTIDGNSYIYNGTSWDMLARGGSEGADGESINWLGTFAAAPDGASENDAYFNSTDGNSYIFDGTFWTILAQHGSNGINGESINWLGEFVSSPASPAINDAYHNTTDGNSYIYTGSVWQILAHHGADGSDGLDGVTINWLGERGTEPEFPVENDAYFNTLDGTSYIFNGTSWDHLALSGTTGPEGPAGSNGISLQWLGSFSAAPANPSLNQAYYNITDGISYVWNGSSWQIISQDGGDGSDDNNGISIHWLGEFDSAPLSPGINDAYYNNISKKSYIWNGTGWGIMCQDGTNGTNGTNGISINWLGTFASAPVTPLLNDAYYNSTENASYVWNGSSWQIISQDGASGTNGINGISIVWLGSFATAPASPDINNAYYNTADRKSYIWDGNSWEMMSQDGTNGTNGTNGISIVWLGSFATAPSSPSLNNAYYNTTDKKSYIYNGSTWNMLAQDGAPAITWIEVTGTSVQAAGNMGYVANNNSSIVNIILPASPVIGNIISVSGAGTGGWRIAMNGGQCIITKSIPNIPGGRVWTQRNYNGNWTSVASSSDGIKLVAVQSNGLFISLNSGVSWAQRYSSGNWSSVASSSDGVKLVAVINGGYIFTSADSGITWTQRNYGGSWTSVASSSDGVKLVAVQYNNGNIFTSTDSGVTWTQRNYGGNWISVASSSDGVKLVAVPNGGYIFTSADSGATWTQRNYGGNWSSVASSSDGVKLVAVINGGYIFTSADSGATWTQRNYGGNWRSVASSSDGVKLVAVQYNGYIFTSTDSGVTWTQRNYGGYWSSVASSSDGVKLAAVQNGGYIFTSVPSTTIGTAGAIFGNLYDAIELQYVGNNTFTVLSHEGYFEVY